MRRRWALTQKKLGARACNADKDDETSNLKQNDLRTTTSSNDVEEARKMVLGANGHDSRESDSKYSLGLLPDEEILDLVQ